MTDLERTLVLWCPDWPVTALERTAAMSDRGRAIRASDPVALFEANRVVACSAAARAEGVRRGQRRREAQSRCPELVIVKHDEQIDHRAFAPVVDRLEEAAPGVQILRPGLVALRARGPARYYGGEHPAALGLLGILADLGVGEARAGVADGPFAAEQAARAAVPAPATGRPAGAAGSDAGPSVRVVDRDGSATFLAPLPVTLLADAELTGLLQRLGVRTLGDFARLSPDDVRGRFGDDGARLHALAAGGDPRRVHPRTAPPDLDATLDLEPPLELVDQVAFAVRTTAERFVDALLATHLVCTSLGVEAVGENGERSERVWMHPRSFTPAEVVDRVRWQLQAGTASGLRSAVARIRLVPESVDAVAHHEQGLWGSGPDERVHHAISRVQGLLGHDGVVTAAVSGGRTLAARQVLVPWGEKAVGTRPGSQPWPGHLPPPHPGTVFPAPLVASVTDAAGREIEVDARDRITSEPAAFAVPSLADRSGPRPVAAWAGPWTVRERWWDAARSGAVHRFQMVADDGTAWLLARHDGGWWAEARYD